MPNLISCGTNTIYKHSGVTSTILTSFNRPSSGAVSGLTYDYNLDNLISSIYNPNEIYVHSGITSTILESFDSPRGYPMGLAFDGNSIISCDRDYAAIYVHSGITITVTDTFSSPSLGVTGLTFDSTNLISCDAYSDKIYKHSGVTSTIMDSFSTPITNIMGLTYDRNENNLISCYDSNYIYIHSGVTSTIIDSFASQNKRGLAYNNLIYKTLSGTLTLSGILSKKLKLLLIIRKIKMMFRGGRSEYDIELEK